MSLATARLNVTVGQPVMTVQAVLEELAVSQVESELVKEGFLVGVHAKQEDVNSQLGSIKDSVEPEEESRSDVEDSDAEDGKSAAV